MRPRIQSPFVPLAVLVVISGVSTAQSPSTLKATARAERIDIQLGQPAAVIVEVKGCDSKPEMQVPTSEDCYITLSGKLAQPSLLAGVNGKGVRGGADAALAGQKLMESLRGLTDKLANDPLLDPSNQKGVTDPDLMKLHQQALGNLNQLKCDDYAFVYHVHAKRVGTVTIPPFTVTANGQTAKTGPIDLHVAPTKGQDFVRVALSLSNPRPIVGQEVRLNVDILVRREQVNYNNKTYPHLPLKDVHLSLPPFEGAGPLELVKPLDQVLKEKPPEQGHHGYKINHLPYEAVFEKESAGAKDVPGWYRRRLEVPVRLKEAGKVALASAGAAGEAWQPAPIGNKRATGKWQPFVATSPPLDVEVRDLPANRPHDFHGNIGELKVTSSASQTHMPAGTPFSLSVRLEGKGYQPHPGSVDLTANPEFTRRFRVHQDNDRAMSDTLREVTYTLRPLDAIVKEVPPISVSYFDSQTDQFRVAKSGAIPLELSPATADSQSGLTENSTEVSRGDELPSLDELAAAHQKGFFKRNFLAALALVVAGVLVLGVLFGGWLRKHVRNLRQTQASRDVARQHQRAAGEVRQQLSSRVGSFHEVRELLQKMLRTRFGMPPGEITPQDAGDHLRQAGIDDGLARSCTELLEECAAAEFAPGVNPVSLTELTARAERLVAHLSSVQPAPV